MVGYAVHWDVHPARVHVVSRHAYTVTVKDEFRLALIDNNRLIYQKSAQGMTMGGREVTLYVVKAEGYTWSTRPVSGRGRLTAPELYTRSRATALIIAGRLVEKLRRVKIKDMVDIENAVYDLVEEMGGDAKDYPSEIDLDELIRKNRDAIHQSGTQKIRP